MWMGIVADEFEVFVLEVEEALYVGVEFHLGQGTRLTRELELGLLDMVQIEVGVARGVDEVARTESRDLCHHLKQQSIGRNIERYAQEGVCRALVELQREASLGIGSVGIVDIELEDGVTRGQRHLVDLSHIPRRDNHATGVGIVLQLIEHILYLVDSTAIIIRP